MALQYGGDWLLGGTSAHTVHVLAQPNMTVFSCYGATVNVPAQALTLHCVSDILSCCALHRPTPPGLPCWQLLRVMSTRWVDSDRPLQG